MHNGEKNFGIKQEAKQLAYEQSVAYYTSQAKLWALRGCESTIKTVVRNYLHTLLKENKKQISGGKSSFHI